MWNKRLVPRPSEEDIQDVLETVVIRGGTRRSRRKVAASMAARMPHARSVVTYLRSLDEKDGETTDSSLTRDEERRAMAREYHSRRDIVMPVEVAKEYPLSLLPWKRNKQVHELTSYLMNVGMGIDFRGRNFLVNYSEHRQRAEELVGSAAVSREVQPSLLLYEPRNL